MKCQRRTRPQQVLQSSVKCQKHQQNLEALTTQCLRIAMLKRTQQRTSKPNCLINSSSLPIQRNSSFRINAGLKQTRIGQRSSMTYYDSHKASSSRLRYPTISLVSLPKILQSKNKSLRRPKRKLKKQSQQLQALRKLRRRRRLVKYQRLSLTHRQFLHHYQLSDEVVADSRQLPQEETGRVNNSQTLPVVVWPVSINCDPMVPRKTGRPTCRTIYLLQSRSMMALVCHPRDLLQTNLVYLVHTGRAFIRPLPLSLPNSTSKPWNSDQMPMRQPLIPRPLRTLHRVHRPCKELDRSQELPAHQLSSALVSQNLPLSDRPSRITLTPSRS